MTTVLKITSSLKLAAGESTRLANAYIDALQERDPSLRIIDRDLARDPLPHLDQARFQAFITKPAERSVAQRAVIAESDALINELRAADLIVLGLPMYNFGIPSQLKAYLDHVARAGETFRYTNQGSVGLLAGRRLVAFATRDGIYAGTPADAQTPHLRQYLGLLGITDVQFVYAEGLAFGSEQRAASLARARAAIQNLVQPVRLAA